MGRLIKTFTFDRNTLKKSTYESAQAVHEHIEKIKKGDELNKNASNIIGALANYMGVFKKTNDGYTITPLSDVFESMYAKDRIDAFQWLLTRALWRFTVPNGTACATNKEAKDLGVTFSLFPSLLGLLIHLQARPGLERFLYFEEYCKIYNEDANWPKPPDEILSILLEMRRKKGIPDSPRRLLGDLESDLSRDNINTYLHKALNQTGLIEELPAGNSRVAIALRQPLDKVLQSRIRYIIDNPVIFDAEKESWAEFISLQNQELPKETTTDHIRRPMPLESEKTLAELVRRAEEDFQAFGIRIQSGLVNRLVASLLAKPFVILTGLSGSGKTKIANALAVWLTGAHGADRDSFDIGAELKSEIELGPMRNAYVVVAVGADWTNRDPLFGYPDALSPGTYCMPTSQALQLILTANNDPKHPYFLILDEMNLSHVERYFADILSAMESREPVALHENRAYRDGEGNPIPEKIVIPPNLFVIGTVNVDETTYMFSPKVLDRANVIEFSLSATDLEQFLGSPKTIDISQLVGRGVDFAEVFVNQAGRSIVPLDEISNGLQEELRNLMINLFELLSEAGAEFGYRPLYEITRFVYFHSTIGGANWNLDTALDAAVMQKLLPKLHGSKTRLGPILSELKKVIKPERFPISAAKIARMEKRLKQNGFTSYAEA